VNDPHDTVLDLHSLMSYGSFTAMLVWSVFFQFYQNICLLFRYICIFHLYFTR